MQISDILTPELCLLGAKASSRKKALQIAAQHLKSVDDKYDDFVVLKALISREQLGSTAIGNGVALPHGRTANCDEPLAILVTLEEGVDFDAPDEEDVGLLFCLLVPEQYDFQKLGGLDQIVEIFRDKILRAQMKNAHSSYALYEIMHQALTQCDLPEIISVAHKTVTKEKGIANETSHT